MRDLVKPDRPAEFPGAARRWWRVRLTLRNTRNTWAREHPLFVMRAVLFCARGLLPEDGRPAFFLRPAHPFGARIRKGARYRLDLLFPRAAPEEIHPLRDALRAHLADPRHNFALEQCGAPEERSLATLRSETPLDPENEELCLDFHAPLSFAPRDRARPWLLEAEALADLLGRLATRVTGEDAPPPPVPEGLTLLSWFWRFERHSHRPRSPGGSRREDLSGMTGPLYLRGPWAAWEPWLRLAAEFPLGRGVSRGQGACELRQDRAFFDRELAHSARYRAAWEQCVADTDRAEPFTHALADPEALAAELARELAAGTYRPAPARRFEIPKKDGASRPISLLTPRDTVAQRALHELLGPVLDRALEEASVGFRRGRSVATARRLIAEALREGCDHVVESDIEDFFDQIPWEGLDRALDRVLPRADRATRAALAAVARAPWADPLGRPRPRDRGLLPGSPLSPLLANLFLDPLDEQMLARGLRFVRFADDFVILTRGEEAARRALDTVRELVGALGLSLQEEKTAIRRVALGFRFLGMNLGGEAGESMVERTALRRPVFIRSPFGFAGLDHDALLVRRGGEIIARVPLARVGQIVIQGSFSLSTRLLEACSRRGIPVSLCTPTGHHRNTFRPDSRRYFARLGRHAAARARLTPAEALAVAADAVRAKLRNQLRWLGAQPGPEFRRLAALLHERLAALSAAESPEALRGVEGAAARAVFAAVNSLLHVPEFRSAARVPHAKPDRWNALLDFGYTQLFTHLNVLTRNEGLNPYLGFLHSPDDRFESLVADLQEPFRPRVDRWAVRSVNLGAVTAEDFEPHPRGGGWRLRFAAYPKLLESFATELDRRYADEPGTLLELLTGQVLLVRSWAEEGAPLRFWSAKV